MPKPIIWSPLSESDFSAILEYLKDNWGSNTVNTFIEITSTTLSQIADRPKQFPLINKAKKVRKCVLTKHNSLFYREGKGAIEVLRIYDTRQDPNKLSF